jgi:hypothetical protein
MNQIHVGGKKVDKECFVDIELDCKGVTLEQALDMLCAASSPRVKAQARLRDLPAEELERIAKDGWKVRLVDLYTRQTRTTTVVKVNTLSDALKAFPERNEFVKNCLEAWSDIGSQEQFEKIYDKHHSKTK